MVPDEAAAPGRMLTVADYTQRVRLAEPLLRIGAPIAGPLLRFNHSLMMQAGERGLARYLREPDRPR
jgi:hypothetical protein